MNKPMRLVLFSLAAWGWFCQTWVGAVILLLLVATNPLTELRWQLKKKQFYRFTDLSLIIFIFFLSWAYLFKTDINPIFIILKWTPVFTAPILLAQLYSTDDKLPSGAVFYSLRRETTGMKSFIDFQYPYVLIVLLSISSANIQSDDYYFFACALIVLILWMEQTEIRYKLLLAMLLIPAFILSYFAQQQLKIFHNYVEDKSVDWLSNWATDPFKSRSSIGDIGELKLSDKIEFRVKADRPMLLLQTSYNRYMGKEWYASSAVFHDFEIKSPLLYEQKVNEQKNSPTIQQLEIYQQFGTDSILALPDGVINITGLEGADLQQTQHGTVKIKNPPPEARYQVYYNARNQWPDKKSDLSIPEQHKDWLETLATELKLKEKNPQEIALIIKNYFHSQYYYTLFTENQSDADQAMRNFILKRKAGHCEYFAIASVFLLRYAGIPARLANGYSMQEYDDSLGLYIVRRRHSHAWALASIEGIWHPVDSTPSQWLDMENKQAGIFQAVYDWFSRQSFLFNQWRSNPQNNSQRSIVLTILMVLLITYLSFLFYKNRKRLRQKQSIEATLAEQILPGQNSEFYLLEQQLRKSMPRRNNNESLQKWIQSLHNKELNRMLAIHYKYRFDPQKLSISERMELQSSVKNWLEKTEKL